MSLKEYHQENNDNINNHVKIFPKQCDFCQEYCVFEGFCWACSMMVCRHCKGPSYARVCDECKKHNWCMKCGNEKSIKYRLCANCLPDSVKNY